MPRVPFLFSPWDLLLMLLKNWTFSLGKIKNVVIHNFLSHRFLVFLLCFILFSSTAFIHLGICHINSMPSGIIKDLLNLRLKCDFFDSLVIYKKYIHTVENCQHSTSLLFSECLGFVGKDVSWLFLPGDPKSFSPCCLLFCRTAVIAIGLQVVEIKFA